MSGYQMYKDFVSNLTEVNKDSNILKSCKSELNCGNYFYHTKFRYCEVCRVKDMC